MKLYLPLTDVEQDITPPVIQGCPNSINVITPVGMTSMAVTWTEPTATDNSGMIPSVTQSHRPGDSFSLGTAQVIYRFTDMSGNEATCSFAVTNGKFAWIL